MKHRKTLFVVLLLLASTVLACEITIEPTGEGAESPTMPPATLALDLLSVPTVPSWPLALSDAFDDQESGFLRDSDETRRYFYQDGHYSIEVFSDDWSNWTWRESTFSDFLMEVDVTAQGEAGKGGVIFRTGGTYRFYYFAVAGDGRYKLAKKLAEGEDDWEDIIEWKRSPHIRTGPATNRLGVVCVGPTISLYVNGKYLDTAQDGTFTEGKIGLMAGTFAGESHALFHFDNLHVYAPAATIPPTATPTTPLPTPTVPNWPVVLADDFDDPESGFLRSSDENSQLFYEDGHYAIGVMSEDWTAWSSRGGNVSQFVMETVVTADAEVGFAGVVFRKTAGSQFYTFVIRPDGHYSLIKHAETVEAILDWRASSHIRTGADTNRLGVVCVGPTIALYVNGEYLASAQDNTFAEGEVGLIAATSEGESHALFHFDNLCVYAATPMVPPTPTATLPATATSTRVPPTSTPVPPSPTPIRPVSTRGPTEFDPIVFAQGLTAESDPIMPSMTFPAGTTQVYAVWACRGMYQGLELYNVWYRDGQEFASGSVYWEQTGERGRWWLQLYRTSGQPLASGNYRLELYVGGRLLQSGTFKIQ